MSIFKQVFAVFFALTLSLMSSLALAALEVNKASAAELDGIKGIGPATSARILEAREDGAFKNWADLMARVKGIGPKSAHKLAANGLTVNGAGAEGLPAVADAGKTKAKPKAAAKGKAAAEAVAP